MRLSNKALRDLLARERAHGDECLQQGELEPVIVELLAARKVVAAAQSYVGGRGNGMQLYDALKEYTRQTRGGGVMLTEREQEETDRCRVAGEHVPRAVGALLAIISRLTSPRAVLDEAERLLRQRKVYAVRFIGSQAHVTRPRQKLPGGQQVGPGENSEMGDSLADAYEALKEGE